MELSGPANGLRVCGDKQESRLSAVQGNASGNLCGSVCVYRDWYCECRKLFLFWVDNRIYVLSLEVLLLCVIISWLC